MRTSHRTVLAGTAALAVVLAGAGASTAAVTTTKVWEDTTLERPAFSASADIVGDERPELVVSDYGAYRVEGSEPVLAPGSMHIFRVGSGLDDWQKITIFDESEGIIFPSQPVIADVDGDGDLDIIHGGGFFWDSATDVNRGSLTWWENQDPHGTKWVRHSLVEDSPWAYHNLQYADLDGDGVKDIVTVGEQGMTKQSIDDDLTELQFFKGLGDGEFGPKVALANRGGSSPVVHDVDGDGDLDVVSAQYFHVTPIVASAETQGDANFIWFENKSSGDDPMSAADFEKHEIARGQGPSYGIYPVPNLYGDGITRYVGVNHTNTTPGTPGPPVSMLADPNAFVLTPGANVKARWTVEELADTYDAGAEWAGEPRGGQAAPGKVVTADFDRDGDLDLVISGDGDFRAMLVEQTAPGVFHQRVLPDSQGWGQAGITSADFDRDGSLEIAMSSFERKTVGVWRMKAVVKPNPPKPNPPVADKAAPVVTIDKPGKKVAKSAKAWKRIKGTVTDRGANASGPKDVRAALVVKTKGQWKYLDGQKWKNAKSKKQAFNKAKVRKDSTVASGKWSITTKAPAKGQLHVRYWATDKAGNTSKPKTLTQKITKK